MDEKLFDDREILQRGRSLLVAAGLLGASGSFASDKLQSDGSTRRFWRLKLDGGPGVVLVSPAQATPAELAEARAAWKIGSHLRACRVAVPELYGWDEESGTLCFEDLGDVRLHQQVASCSGEERLHWYRRVMAALVAMQLSAASGFDPAWCWDTPRYDRALMLERESRYFLRAFWRGLLGREVSPGIEEEFAAIADAAAITENGFFLHRDCQSRNIMVRGDRLSFIDFQGGRLGPLGYDVASLLLDPYAGLTPSLQETLLAEYIKMVEARLPGAGAEVAASYPFLALQRNLQIIGAFSFLWRERGKPFFRAYLRPSLVSLHGLLATPSFADFPVLGAMACHGLAALDGLGI